MNNAEISVIVPIYNMAQYLDKCIKSIMRQTYKRLQIILVDDGSTDNTSDLCDLYAEQDRRIKVIHKKNGGLVSARKAGMAAAHGAYVGFVDGDDWIEPRMYEHLLKFAVKYDAEMVLGGHIEDVDGQTVHKINRLSTGIYDQEDVQRKIHPYMLCAGDFSGMGVQPYLWNKLVRRELAYEHIMAVDDRIRVGEDVAAVMSMFLKADKVVITDDCDYHYCIRRTSMMQRCGSMEKEWEGLCILHKFLGTVFSRYASAQIRLGYQLNHYTIGNMLTRAYGKLARRAGEDVLWPFGCRLGDNQKYIVYSAGNFGRQVHAYLQSYYPESVTLWVDRNYQSYQSLGLPVCSVEDAVRENQTNILIAVLDLHLAGTIREDLLQLGMCRERIYCISITEDQVEGIIGSI